MPSEHNRNNSALQNHQTKKRLIAVGAFTLSIAALSALIVLLLPHSETLGQNQSSLLTRSETLGQNQSSIAEKWKFKAGPKANTRTNIRSTATISNGTVYFIGDGSCDGNQS